MAWLREADARTLIHGHTHQPADHALADGRQRLVLSDWDLQAANPRAEVLRLSRPDGGGPATVQRLTLAQAC
jgi:UDP-2,3-diacylglucosamine hydrolase